MVEAKRGKVTCTSLCKYFVYLFKRLTQSNHIDPDNIVVTKTRQYSSDQDTVVIVMTKILVAMEFTLWWRETDAKQI